LGNGGLVHDTRYWLIYNAGIYLLFDSLGFGLAIVGLKIYVGLQDRKYKKEDYNPRLFKIFGLLGLVDFSSCSNRSNGV